MTLEQKVNSLLKKIAAGSLKLATRAIAGLGTAKWLFSTYPMYQMNAQTGEVSLEWAAWAGAISRKSLAARSISSP